MTESDTEIACALDREELAARLRAIRERVVARASSVREVPGGARLRFEATQEMRDTLDEFIALENQCCSFLQFDFPQITDSDDLVLDVCGPEGARALIREFLASGAAADGCAC